MHMRALSFFNQLLEDFHQLCHFKGWRKFVYQNTLLLAQIQQHKQPHKNCPSNYKKKQKKQTNKQTNKQTQFGLPYEYTHNLKEDIEDFSLCSWLPSTNVAPPCFASSWSPRCRVLLLGFDVVLESKYLFTNFVLVSFPFQSCLIRLLNVNAKNM